MMSMMSETPDSVAPRIAGISKRLAMIVALCLVSCMFAGVWLVCAMEYNGKKRDVLFAQKESMDIWVSGTVNAVTLWAQGLESQAKRVSGSELYRLFASDVSRLDEKTKSMLNEVDGTLPLSEGFEALAEEVPLIRNLLFDFMTYSGLMDARIVDRSGQTLLSALPRPTPVTPEQVLVTGKAVESGRVAYSPVRASASGLVVDLGDPLLSVMSGESQERPVGALLLTTPVTGQIAQFLTRDLRQANLKPRFLQQKDTVWEEVRVQEPVPAPLSAAEVTALAPVDDSLSFALRPGQNNEEVYSLGSRVPGTDWWIVLEIPASVVQAELSAQAWMIYGIGALIGLGSVLLLALLWWVAVGRQQKAIAERFQHLYLLINRQKRLLDSVNVSLDVGLFMANLRGEIQVGNRAFAEIACTDEAELPGSSLGALFEGQVAGRLLDWIRKVAGTNENSTFELALAHKDGDRLYRVTLFPFVEGTDATAADVSTGAVAIMQDITEFRRNSEKRRRQQVHTMQAFVRAIEGVDPYLAGHSRKMAELGRLVAGRMGLSDADCNTVVQAAELSQVGKLFVPRDLLTKTGKLTEAELAEMNKAPEHAYRVLKDIDFDLPIPQAVHEMYERMDGTGYPRGLKGADIAVHARVLAVVNAFSAMVSPRSYRSGMSFDDAILSLRNNTASYDQQVVALLDDVVRTPEGAAVASSAVADEEDEGSTL